MPFDTDTLSVRPLLQQVRILHQRSEAPYHCGGSAIDMARLSAERLSFSYARSNFRFSRA